MEIRAFALSLLQADSVEGKLRRPGDGLTDDAPGESLRVDAPTRPRNLTVVTGGRVKVPRPRGMHDVNQRGRILHALANHELQAAELFAWALLAFPDAPRAFRRGCLGILDDEQRHCSMYAERMAEYGVSLGDFPVTALFWRQAARIETPLQFVCAMGLTYENANLDFATELESIARAAGDDATADVIRVVHEDEIRHVAFAVRWLRELKDPELSDWDAFVAAAPLRAPERARGASFDVEAREAAGFDPEFIARLQATTPTTPGGGPR